MTTLTLLIDERWPDTLSADWVLRGPRGAVLEQGSSEPRHWPAADRRVAVLAGAQVSLCALQLPRSRRQERARLIAYALEERLPADTDGQHFTVIEQQGERAVVAIVEAARLRRVVDACASLGQPLAAAFGRLQGLPRLADTAVCVDEGAMRHWRWPDGSGLSEDLPLSPSGGEPVSWLARTARQAAAVQRLLGPAAVAAALQLPAVEDDGRGATEWHLPTATTSLLHDEFAPRQSGGSAWHRLRWPLGLAAAALMLHLAIGVGSALVARQGEAQFKQKTRAIFETTFPGATVVDPILQMRRQLNEIRPLRGGLRDDDMLALLAALSDALAADSREAVSRFSYQSGALELELSASFDAPRRQALIAALAMRGVTAQTSPAGSGKLTLRRSA